MTDARRNILDRLRDAPQPQAGPLPPAQVVSPASQTERIEQFISLLESVRGKVHRVDAENWRQTLYSVLDEHHAKRVLIAPSVWPGSDIAAQPPQGVELRPYDRPIEEWKHGLFNEVDAAVTGAAGGIAETGSLVLWPTPDEPRLMSLVPPLHIVVMDAGRLYGTFAEVVADQGWAERMPTNALLISGPSKSADIEQVLAYGVHGPKELVVILRE